MANLSVLKWRNGASVQQFCPFPVGGVYISASNVTPSALWPGTTWTRIAAGTFLVSSGGATTGDYAVGNTGGAASVTLSAGALPQIHLQSKQRDNSGGANAWGIMSEYGRVGWEDTYVRLPGGNKPHENRPPYLSVDMWRRTA